MSSSKPVKKKIVVTKQQEKKAVKSTKKVADKQEEQTVPMLFKRKNYYLIIGGIALIFLGFLLMSGGAMPSPEVWDESLIYNPRRTILAPIVILGGLVMVLISIFKK
jgi:uncharacterized membrane protein YiaA